MRNNKKISSIFAATLAGILLTSPLSYVKAEEKLGGGPGTGPAPAGPAAGPAKPAAPEKVAPTTSAPITTTVRTTTERLTTTTERTTPTTTTEKSTTTERESSTTEETTEKEEKVVTRWVDERFKDNKSKDLKPKEEGEREAPKGPEIEGYEFVETDDSDPKEVLHIYKKKEVTYKWVSEIDGKKEDLSEKKSIEDLTETDIDSKDKDKIKELEFDKQDVSRDKLTVTFIYKKKGEKSSSNDSTKEDDKKPEDNKGSESSKSEDKKPEDNKGSESSKSEEKKDGDKPESTTAPKTEDKTKEGETSKTEGDSKPVENNATSSTVSTTVAPAATEAVTTATNSNGEQNAIVQTTTTVPTTTKKDELPTPPKYTSIFLNEKTGWEIINPRDGKDSIAIAGYGFVRTAVSEDGLRYVHYYRPSEGDKDSNKMTVWKDAYSGEYILTSKQGDHPAGKVAGYTHINTKSLGDVTVHYYEKNTKSIYNWSYHRDIDTGEIIYYDYNRVGWHHPLTQAQLYGYVYVNTDSWTDSNGVTYFTHYYKQVAKVNHQVDPAKVFTVWVDEYGDQILPSKMGSHEAGELEGYEFIRTVSINNGYGIAHVYKNTSGEKKIAGKDKDKSVGYRVRSMLPGTNAAGGNSILPMGIIGATGVAVAGGVYYVLRRKNNNDQNNNNFPPYSGQ